MPELVNPYKSLEHVIDIPVLAAQTIERCYMIARDPSTGYATNAADTAGHKVWGIAYEQANNAAGASGAKTVCSQINGAGSFAIAAATQADVGKTAYVMNAYTVTTTPGSTTHQVIAGTVIALIDSTHVFVHVPGLAAHTLPRLTVPREIMLTDFFDTASLVLTATPAAGNFNRVFSAPVLKLQGVGAKLNTKTDVTYVNFTLPENFDNSVSPTLRLRVKVEGTGTLGACTINAAAQRLVDGVAAADVIAVVAKATSGTIANYDFTVASITLFPGDTVVFTITGVTIESADVALLYTTLYKAQLLIATKF